MNFPRWNHYHCPVCQGVTIARHDDEGVTPFLIRCRVKDIVAANGAIAHGCEGLAESHFFADSQDDSQTPHVIFYRPGETQAMLDISERPERERGWLLDHYIKGGALMREVPPK